MLPLPDTVTRRVGEVEAELRTLVDGGPPALAMLPRAMCELVGSEKAFVYALRQKGEGHSVDQGFALGFQHEDEDAASIFDAYISRQKVAWTGYNPNRPEPQQRNRVFTTDAIVRLTGVRALEDIPVVRDFFPRAGLVGRDQLRVVVCDGPAALGCVLAFRAARFTNLERHTLQRLVPALQRRLTIERTLATATRTRLILDAAFEAIPAPAFVTDELGNVCEANAAGQLWLETEGRAARAEIAEATKRRRHPRFDGVPVVAPGASWRCLLVQRRGAEATARLRAAHAAKRWSLTRRQGEVLALVVEGLATRTMAAVLGVSESTVEAHLTAIYDKSQLEGRAEVTVAVWRGAR
jgi:DNA-binding CsgD family transcriptional regulator